MCLCLGTFTYPPGHDLDRHNPISFNSLKTAICPSFWFSSQMFLHDIVNYSMVYKHGAFVISNDWSMWCPLGAFARLGAFSLGGGLD
jgi:hypothetical protein